MDGPQEWIGARITWRISPTGTADVLFDGWIDGVEGFSDGTLRISGAAATGGRFVLVSGGPPA